MDKIILYFQKRFDAESTVEKSSWFSGRFYSPLNTYTFVYTIENWTFKVQLDQREVDFKDNTMNNWNIKAVSTKNKSVTDLSISNQTSFFSPFSNTSSYQVKSNNKSLENSLVKRNVLIPALKSIPGQALSELIIRKVKNTLELKSTFSARGDSLDVIDQVLNVIDDLLLEIKAH